MNTTKLNLWLQVSDHSIKAKLFYEAKGFYYKGMNKDDIAESLRDFLNKTTWIDQSHMLLYCCNDGHFITNETSEDSTIENESEADDQLFVDTSSNSSEVADEIAEIVSDQQAEDSKTSNVIKIPDSKGDINEIDLNQED